MTSQELIGFRAMEFLNSFFVCSSVLATSQVWSSGRGRLGAMDEEVFVLPPGDGQRQALLQPQDCELFHDGATGHWYLYGCTLEDLFVVSQSGLGEGWWVGWVFECIVCKLVSGGCVSCNQVCIYLFIEF